MKLTFYITAENMLNISRVIRCQKLYDRKYVDRLGLFNKAQENNKAFAQVSDADKMVLLFESFRGQTAKYIKFV